MKYRPARSVDAFALVEILQERHPETRYADTVAIDEVVARKVFAHAAQRHGGQHEGATFLQVAESDERIEAFMLGELTRIYMVGDKLCATDLLLIGRKDCDPRALTPLVDAFLAWAEASPKVHEITLSWSDAVPGSEGVCALYERKGFTLCQRGYRRDARPTQERIAA